MPERNENETLMDKFLLLYLINKTNKNHRIEGNTKLQKMVFHVEKKLLEGKIKAFNYKFFIYHFGPFSKGLREDFSELWKNSLATFEEGSIKLTESGINILKNLKEIIQRNKVIISIINKVVDELGKYPGLELESKTYDTEINYMGSRKKIKDIPKFSDVLEKIESPEAEKELDMKESESETLEIFLDEEAYESIKKASESAKKGRFVKIPL